MRLIFSLFIVLLVSCTTKYATNGENIYLRADNGASLVVPAPLTTDNISHYYDLPQRPENPRVDISLPTV